jgi:Fic family protein
VLHQKGATLHALRLFDVLPDHPMITLAHAVELLATTKPTAIKAIEALRGGGVLHEITGRRRDRVYAYRAYLNVLAEDAG